MIRSFWRALLCLLCCSLSVRAQTPAAPAAPVAASPASAAPTSAEVERAKAACGATPPVHRALADARRELAIYRTIAGG